MLEDANLTEEDVEKGNERTWSSSMTVAYGICDEPLLAAVAEP